MDFLQRPGEKAALVRAILGNDWEGKDEVEGAMNLCDELCAVSIELDSYRKKADQKDEKIEKLERKVAYLRFEDKNPLEEEIVGLRQYVDTLITEEKKLREENKETERKLAEVIKAKENELKEIEEKSSTYWQEWAKKEVKSKAGKLVGLERKKWQAKGKAVPVEMVTTASQTDLVEVVVAEIGIQTEKIRDEVTQRTEEEDVMMEDRNEVAIAEWQLYEDLSRYDEEETDAARVIIPPMTKKPAATRPAGKTGKQSQPVKTHQESPWAQSRAMVIHGIQCHTPLASIIQDVEVKGTMKAGCLLGGAWRLSKAPSFVVIFFNKVLDIGTHLKLKGSWHPIEAYDFDKGGQEGVHEGTFLTYRFWYLLRLVLIQFIHSFLIISCVYQCL